VTQEIRDISLPPTRVAIVSLSKYPELFSGLDENINKYITGSNVDRILVRDGLMIESAPGWYVVDGPEDFNFSGNVNLGWQSVDENSDIFFISDDVRLTEENTVQKLIDLAYSDSNIGLLAPRVIGPADNPLQIDPPKDRDLIFSERYIVFVCLYIKRKVIKDVGYMDKETFNGYGWDDVDYSRRVKNAGFKLAIAPNVEVIHGVKGRGTETFLKSEKGLWKRLERQNEHNAQAFFNKWGDNDKG
jgi:GT2 family glycosyltransferase